MSSVLSAYLGFGGSWTPLASFVAIECCPPSVSVFPTIIQSASCLAFLILSLKRHHHLLKWCFPTWHGSRLNNFDVGRCSSCAKHQTENLAPLWLISIPPFITFITVLMKHGARLQEALTGLFKTTCTDFIQPWLSFQSSAPYVRFSRLSCHEIDFCLDYWTRENLSSEKPPVRYSIHFQLNHSSNISKWGLNMTLLVCPK